MRIRLLKYLIQTLTLLFILLVGGVLRAAESSAPVPAFAGIWVVDNNASDDTDKQVELAIKQEGGRLPRTKKKGRGRYRGGPANQAMYDHISYDEILQIKIDTPKIEFIYPKHYRRVFYTDDRSRTVNASGGDHSDRQDYSFGDWENGKLLVESRPRDGGWITETYSLQDKGKRLRLFVRLKPSTFMVPIEIVRIFNRYQQTK